MYTSVLSGDAWVKELLGAHPERFKENIGISKHVFHKLIYELKIFSGLHHTQHISQEEQLALFLYMARTGSTQRVVRERFQHGAETVSRFVLRLSSSLKNYYIIFNLFQDLQLCTQYACFKVFFHL